MHPATATNAGLVSLFDTWYKISEVRRLSYAIPPMVSQSYTRRTTSAQIHLCVDIVIPSVYVLLHTSVLYN